VALQRGCPGTRRRRRRLARRLGRGRRNASSTSAILRALRHRLRSRGRDQPGARRDQPRTREHRDFSILNSTMSTRPTGSPSAKPARRGAARDESRACTSAGDSTQPERAFGFSDQDGVRHHPRSASRAANNVRSRPGTSSSARTLEAVPGVEATPLLPAGLCCAQCSKPIHGPTPLYRYRLHDTNSIRSLDGAAERRPAVLRRFRAMRLGPATRWRRRRSTGQRFQYWMDRLGFWRIGGGSIMVISGIHLAPHPEDRGRRALHVRGTSHPWS
jgi:hypothetical protein